MKRKLELDSMDCCLPFSYDLTDPPFLVHDKNSLSSLQTYLASITPILMAMDTERRPSPLYSSKRRNDKTELLQLSVRDASFNETCYILDLKSLSQDKGENCLLLILNNAFKKAMADFNCVKIGHAIADDFREILKSYPIMTSFMSPVNVLDTNLMYLAIKPEQKQSVSLKFLTRKYLHFNLIKTQQLTDWSVRPLSPEQIHYAACDSVVLLRLYDEMMCHMEERKNDIANVLEDEEEDDATTSSAASVPESI